jgi:outer membrane immunogenic protein
MKRILLAGIALLTLSAAQPTLAADAPIYKGPAPIAAALFNWSGFYLGINGGYGWGQARLEAVSGSTGFFNVNGGLVGGTIGWNWQAPGSAIVWGIEGDLDWTNIHGTTPCPNPAFTCGAENSWLGTVRGRLGWAANTVLLYATGGFAFGDVNATVSGSPGQKATQTGWTVGGGVEAAIARNWSVKAEYLYVDLGTFTCTPFNCSILPVNVTFYTHIVRVGANWRF